MVIEEFFRLIIRYIPLLECFCERVSGWREVEEFFYLFEILSLVGCLWT